jgi:hypothetical protein
LAQYCEQYLNRHDNGAFRKPVQELQAWVGRVRGPRDYWVKAVRGDFAVKIGRWYTKGPDLSVTIEVNGVTHGPSGIVKNNYDPRWDYEFPRGVTWKPGDSVRVIVRDHDFFDRVIIDHTSSGDDPLAMRLLSGKFESDQHAVYFESDFNMPYLPPAD